MFRDDLWAAEIVPGYDVPGLFILRARRHAERLTGLDDGELAAFARRAPRSHRVGHRGHLRARHLPARLRRELSAGGVDLLLDGLRRTSSRLS